MNKYPRKDSKDKHAKLIAIACEGEITEPNYFKKIKENFDFTSRLIIKLIEREDPSCSDPKFVLESIEDFKNNEDLIKTDEIWVVIDVDQWGNKLDVISKECHNKKYNLAISNPMFEIWLLLHYTDLNDDMINKIIKSKNKKSDIKNYYQPNDQTLYKNSDKIETAINRAKNLDTDDSKLYPEPIGTRVYKLAEKILSNISN